MGIQIVRTIFTVLTLFCPAWLRRLDIASLLRLFTKKCFALFSLHVTSPIQHHSPIQTSAALGTCLKMRCIAKHLHMIKDQEYLTYDIYSFIIKLLSTTTSAKSALRLCGQFVLLCITPKMRFNVLGCLAGGRREPLPTSSQTICDISIRNRFPAFVDIS